MGLLSRIAAGVEVTASPADNASEKNENLTLSENRFSFFEFTKKHSLKKVAIFAKNGVFYSFCASQGFDGDTILQSLSTVDFWEGTISEDKWNYFSKDENNLNSMLQFFSDSVKNNIVICAVYCHKDKILILASEDQLPSNDELDSIAKDFDELNSFKNYKIDTDKESSNKNGEVIKINLENAISEKTGNLSADIKKNISNAFLQESIYNLNLLCEEKNNSFITSYSTEDNTISFHISSGTHISINALNSFFKQYLSKVFKDASNFLKIVL